MILLDITNKLNFWIFLQILIVYYAIIKKFFVFQIPDSVFMDLQAVQLNILNRMLDSHLAALEYVRSHPDDFGVSEMMEQMLNCVENHEPLMQ